MIDSKNAQNCIYTDQYGATDILQIAAIDESLWLKALYYGSEAVNTKSTDPLNIKLLDVDAMIKDEEILQVKSEFVKVPSNDAFHPEGLYSEEIFGEIASPQRLVKFGFIDLNTKLFHPRVYRNIVRLKSLYNEIMAGKSYAIFDKAEKDFIKANEGDDGADTGYQFFIEHFPEMKFKETSSLKRSDIIKLINNTPFDKLTLNRLLVMPAGLRDFKEEGGSASTEEINKLYVGLLNLTNVIPNGMGENPWYNDIRYAIQLKTVQIVEYIENILSGKTGAMENRYGKRGIMLGTRNVISAADMSSKKLGDPKMLKSDETKVPLFQSAKAFQPAVVHSLRFLFFEQVFDISADQVSLIDPKSYNLVYQTITDTEKNKFLSSDGIISLINIYGNPDIRNKPLKVFTANGKGYYMYMVYDTGDTITVLRDVEAFKREFTGDDEFKPELLRPLTFNEIMYIATYQTVTGKHVLVSRYPIAGVKSIYPSKVHLMSTADSRTVQYVSSLNPDIKLILPEYPVLGSRNADSCVLHPSRLSGLDGDHDGDVVSNHSIISDEANTEIDDKMNSLQAIILPDGSFAISGDTYLIDLAMYNFSRRAS